MTTLIQQPAPIGKADMTNKKSEAFNQFIAQLPSEEEAQKLRDAFSKIQNPSHWKDEISCTIKASEFEFFADAVSFMTGSELEIMEQFEIDGVRMFNCYSIGYWGAEEMAEMRWAEEAKNCE